jgi:monoterpene epsilon-lactone hydrolase
MPKEPTMSMTTEMPNSGRVDADSFVHIPAFTLPFSNLASPEAKAWFAYQARHPLPTSAAAADIQSLRKAVDEALSLPMLAKQQACYTVTREPRTIAGVYTEVFTPKDGVDPKNKKRVLLNLHGGGFMIGARTLGAVESIPIASVGRITVISVDYRMAPEHKFPAASEDVAAVYQELLKDHAPGEIGIYGCSAGGLLAGEAVAWFHKVGLPSPGAIGVFCASLGQFTNGDSPWISPMIGGLLPAPSGPGWGAIACYYGDTAADDPLAVPEASPALLATFPPTLFITGSRAGELSGAIHSHIQLLKAGAVAEIAIWDGLDHGFLNNPDLPESREAYDIIVKFFDKHLMP